MFTVTAVWLLVVGIIFAHIALSASEKSLQGREGSTNLESADVSKKINTEVAAETWKSFVAKILWKNRQSLSESFSAISENKNQNSLLYGLKKGRRLKPKGSEVVKGDAHLSGISARCSNNSFITRKGKCRPCKQCASHQVVVLPCSTYKDTVCRRKRRKQKRANCAGLFHRRFNKGKTRSLKIKRIHSFQLRRCFVYFILMQLNKKESKRESRKRPKRDAGRPMRKKKFRINSDNWDFPGNMTTKVPTTAFGFPTTGFGFPKPGEKFEESDRPSVRGKAADFDIQAIGKTNGSFKDKDSTVSPTGTAPWVFITIGVVIFMVIVTVVLFTLLYRKRKNALQGGRHTKECSGPGPSAQNHDTHRSGSTDKSTDRSKSTVSTYLSRDSERAEAFELVPLAERSGSHRQRASVHSLFEEVPLTSQIREDDKYADVHLPRVQVFPVSNTLPVNQSTSLLRSCVSKNDAEDDDVKAPSTKSLFSKERDDGNRLRGGNGDFQRRYVDVDFVHNDIDVSHKYRKSQDSPERRSRNRISTRSRSYVGSPEHEQSYQFGRRNRSDRSRNESNASSATSHHSARSYISIPPTSPSENYIEAGSDDTSIRSERSTPPIKMEWLTKNIKVNAKNEFGNYQSNSSTQTDSEVSVPKCKTVFGTPWQFGGTFNNRGGVMQAKDSDVSLMVVSEAIPKGDYVDIYGAVFTDTTEIRRKFDFPSEESLITPVVEYHAVPNFPFQRPVCVQLPHSLPEEFDTSIVKVYTFTTDERGWVSLHCLPLKDKSNTQSDGWWEKAFDGCSIHINTTHFSGYFCTLCETSSLPSICTMVFGSHVQITQSRREVRVILYIWDRRLTIKDYLERFRKHESDVDRQLLTDMQIPLLDAASSDSRLVMRMEVMGMDEDQQCWRHVFRPDGSRPLFKPLQVRRLSEIVHCCRQTDPIRVEWAVENVPQQVPSAVFQCCIDIMHVHESTRDYETAMREDNDDLMRTFYVRDLKVTPHPSQEPNQSSHKVDLKRALSEVMNLEQTERVCQEFGISPKDIGNFRKKYTEQEHFQVGLVDECLRRHGKVNFVKQLPQILEKLCLIRVLTELEEKKIIVKDLRDFTGVTDVPHHPAKETDVTSPKQIETVESNSSSSVGGGGDSTDLKSPYRGSSYSSQRNRSVSPQYRRSSSGDKSHRSGRHSQERQRPQNQGAEKYDEVFVHDVSGSRHDAAEEHSHPSRRRSGDAREFGRRGRSQRHSSPPKDYDVDADCCSSNGLTKRNSQYDHNRYTGQDSEERQPLNYQKSSSSGSDSVLRDSSIPSRDNVAAAADSSFPSSSRQSRSMIAQADSKDFAEPYPEEFLNEFQKQTFKKEIAASRNSNMYNSDDYVAAYPEIAEDLHLSSSGPQAIPPVSSSTPNHHVVPRPSQLSGRQRSKERSKSSDQEQTSKKEVYGFQTIV